MPAWSRSEYRISLVLKFSAGVVVILCIVWSLFSVKYVSEICELKFLDRNERVECLSVTG